jgi:hypothetical protein
MFLLLSRVTGAGDLNLFAKEIMDRSCAKIREHKFCINDVQNLDDGSGSFFFFFFFCNAWYKGRFLYLISRRCYTTVGFLWCFPNQQTLTSNCNVIVQKH